MDQTRRASNEALLVTYIVGQQWDLSAFFYGAGLTHCIAISMFCTLTPTGEGGAIAEGEGVNK
jgi:hypothetical protein